MIRMFNILAIIFAVHYANSAPADNNNSNNSSQPIFIPGKCPQNQLLFPGARKSDPWLCDCAPEYIYNAKDDTCYEAYEKGPCPAGKMFVLMDNRKTSKKRPGCVRNRCKDGEVWFKDQCWELNQQGGPCAKKNGGNDGILKINPLTVKPECMISEDHGLCLTCNIKSIPLTCHPGRRNQTENCRTKFEFDDE